MDPGLTGAIVWGVIVLLTIGEIGRRRRWRKRARAPRPGNAAADGAVTDAHDSRRVGAPELLLARSAHEIVRPLAAELRRLHDRYDPTSPFDPSDPMRTLSREASFTHVPIAATPDELVALLQSSPAGPLLVREGEALTAPGTTRWSGEPLPQVICHYADVIGAHATASVWWRPRWSFDGAALMISLDFGSADLATRATTAPVFGPKVATQELTLFASREGLPRLSRSVIDHRRDDVAQGYEGENSSTITPTLADVRGFVELVARVVRRRAGG
jgi:hypothetical protein